MHPADLRALRASLRRLGLRSYAAYRRRRGANGWPRVRALVRGRPCLVCGDKARVQAHHVTYATLGAETLTDVVPLCRRHHRAAHLWLEAAAIPVRGTPAAVAALVLLEAGVGRAPSVRRRRKRRP